MAKSQSGCGAVLGVLVIGGLIVSAPAVAAAIVLIIIAAGVLVSIAHLATLKAAKQAVLGATSQHAAALVRRREQLRTVDAYGAVQTGKWFKEIEYFYNTQVSPTLSQGQRKAVAKNWPQIVQLIEGQIGSVAAIVPAFAGVSVNDMAPVEFESFCAARLREAGWDARTTKGSGDQGVDVIAERAGVRVVVQCKLYSAPVGNKAVQEVAAGRSHYGAQCAAVVSNRTYTPSAEQLARTNGVLLLHHSQLGDLAALVGGIVRSPALVPPATQARPQPEPLRANTSAPARSSFGTRR